MDTVIYATLISVLGAGLIGVLFHYLRELSTRFASLELAVTSQLTALDTKFTGELRAQGERIDRVYDILLVHGERLVGLEEAVKAQGQRLVGLEEAVKAQGQRLARIELKLGIEPPAEAA